MATNGFLSGPIRSATSLIDPTPNNDMLQRFLAALGGRSTATSSSSPRAGAPDLLGVVKEMRKSKDTVGNFNRNSNLPSYAEGSTSPFNGFFKPMGEAFARPPAENLGQINERLFPGMAPKERAAAYQVGAPQAPESVRWHPNDQAMGMVPGSEDRVGPDGMSAGRDLYSPFAPGGVRGSSTFETPQQPIGFRELGTNPSPEMIRAILADPGLGQPPTAPIPGAPASNQPQPSVAAQPQSPAVPPAASPLGVPQPGGGMAGIPQISPGAVDIFRMLSGLLGR